MRWLRHKPFVRDIFIFCSFIQYQLIFFNFVVVLRQFLSESDADCLWKSTFESFVQNLSLKIKTSWTLYHLIKKYSLNFSDNFWFSSAFWHFFNLFGLYGSVYIWRQLSFSINHFSNFGLRGWLSFSPCDGGSFVATFLRMKTFSLFKFNWEWLFKCECRYLPSVILTS